MSLINKYQKSHWKNEDFGRGKSKVAKARHRRIIKKKSLREYLKDLKITKNELDYRIVV